MRITGRDLRQIIREALMEADPRRAQGDFSGARLFQAGALGAEDEPTDPGIDLGSELEEEELTLNQLGSIAMEVADGYLKSGKLGPKLESTVSSLISQGALAGRSAELDRKLKYLMRETAAQIGMKLSKLVDGKTEQATAWGRWLMSLPSFATPLRSEPDFGLNVPAGGFGGGTIDDIPEKVIAAFSGLLTVRGVDYGLIITDGGRLNKSRRGAPGPMRVMTYRMEAAPDTRGFQYDFG